MAYDDRQLGYARTIVSVGRELGITVRGLIMGLSCGLVETNLKNYANKAVPASLTVPYDAIGSDSKSCGIMQQQPQWWGNGTGIDLMNPEIAARLFYEALLRLDYNNAQRTPGSYVQKVQGSSFPDRYDERWPEASALYDLIKSTTSGGNTVAVDYGITHTIFGYNPDSIGTGNSNGPRAQTLNLGLHTQQGGTGDAIGLVNYGNGAQVSYNVCVDDERTVLQVPHIEAPWAAADANAIAWHLCFAGSYAEWAEGRWLSADASDGLDENAMLWRGAKAAAAACQQFGIPAKRVGEIVYQAANWPREKGITGHAGFGSRGGGHWDPGKGFPYTEFVRRVQSFLTPSVPSAPPINLIEAEAKVAASWIGARDGAAGVAGERILSRAGTKIGSFVPYENAHIYWAVGTNAAYAIPHGGLFEAYSERRWEQGPLGFPIMRHSVVTAHGVTAGVQSFKGGVLFTPVGGPVAGCLVHGEIGKMYAALDWEQGELGFPTSDEYAFPDYGKGCIRQDFAGGSLVWTPTGVVTINRKVLS